MNDTIKFALTMAAMVAVIVMLGMVGLREESESNEQQQDTAAVDVDTIETGEAENWHERSYELAMAFAKVESGMNPNARNGNCVGLLQISPVMVKECNRILGYEYFTLMDREDMYASIAMWNVIMAKKNPELDVEKACKVWNPTAGNWYQERVEKAMEGGAE